MLTQIARQGDICTYETIQSFFLLCLTNNCFKTNVVLCVYFRLCCIIVLRLNTVVKQLLSGRNAKVIKPSTCASAVRTTKQMNCVHRHTRHQDETKGKQLKSVNYKRRVATVTAAAGISFSGWKMAFGASARRLCVREPSSLWRSARSSRRWKITHVKCEIL